MGASLCLQCPTGTGLWELLASRAQLSSLLKVEPSLLHWDLPKPLLVSAGLGHPKLSYTRTELLQVSVWPWGWLSVYDSSALLHRTHTKPCSFSYNPRGIKNCWP